MDIQLFQKHLGFVSIGCERNGKNYNQIQILLFFSKFNSKKTI